MKLAVVCCMVMVLSCLLVDDAGCQAGEPGEGRDHGRIAFSDARRIIRDASFRAGRARRSLRGP